MDINKKVFLLAIYKKEESETLNDIVLKLEETGLFSLKDGKKFLKEFKKEELVSDSYLTLKGQIQAQDVEKEFKI
ncbi:hypothetical protein [Poseidonibacter lekithochrous]|uniref:hypothetical protein n=1 Tax=Poseidonibacter lekithochrous TaxID=1904463 RepID=UPI0008FC5018|nr:hypothetical protein [Poseidonibacter lekithochrous]QKJ24050.1 hypothetical protein ALEK_2827 [Poseidonibacter lekithochrous]